MLSVWSGVSSISPIGAFSLPHSPYLTNISRHAYWCKHCFQFYPRHIGGLLKMWIMAGGNLWKDLCFTWVITRKFRCTSWKNMRVDVEFVVIFHIQIIFSEVLRIRGFECSGTSFSLALNNTRSFCVLILFTSLYIPCTNSTPFNKYT